MMPLDRKIYISDWHRSQIKNLDMLTFSALKYLEVNVVSVVL